MTVSGGTTTARNSIQSTYFTPMVMMHCYSATQWKREARACVCGVRQDEAKARFRFEASQGTRGEWSHPFRSPPCHRDPGRQTDVQYVRPSGSNTRLRFGHHPPFLPARYGCTCYHCHPYEAVVTAWYNYCGVCYSFWYYYYCFYH